MPEYPETAIGNLVDLKEGQVALTRFIVQREDGLYVQPAQLDSPEVFLDFVNRVIGIGLYFRSLDYAHFSSLLYDDPPRTVHDAPTEIFLAADITTFQPQRQSLYKALRIQGNQAVYLFEPLYRDSLVDPEATETQTGGRAGGPESSREVSEERICLDVDEFIAAAWAKGIRFGIDVAAVREGILLDKPERRVVARSRLGTPGKDAELRELASGLHRNNAPRRLLGDRVDLRQFETRYPQVAAGLQLVQKIPRTLGVDGRDVKGLAIPVGLPKDFDLQNLAGPGTEVCHNKDGEFLVASVCGFLNIDMRTNQFSVAEKIVSHEGVSARTTGDLWLTGEVYEQHGEIQEKRVVKCRSIMAYADVFGHIESTGGLVRLKNNLIGGSASNAQGDIVVEGVASGATLIAHEGCIQIKRAENCVIVARRVVVEQATRCDIVGDELSIDVCDSGALAAKSLHVAVARSRRELDNVFLLLLPDLSAYDKQIEALRQKDASLAKMLAAQRDKIEALRSETEVARYLLLAEKLRRNEISLRPEQQVGWRRLSAAVAPALRTLSQLGEAANQVNSEANAVRAQIEALLAAKAASCQQVSGTVARVEGETRVSTLLIRQSETPLSALTGKELKARLRRTDTSTTLLFAAADGQFAWNCAPPLPISR